MRDFLIVISQLFFIACIQLILEMIVDKTSNPLMYKILNIACSVGSLYILVNYAYNSLIKEMAHVFKIIL